MRCTVFDLTWRRVRSCSTLGTEVWDFQGGRNRRLETDPAAGQSCMYRREADYWTLRKSAAPAVIDIYLSEIHRLGAGT